MNKIKSGFLLLAALFVSNFLTAQSIEDGKKFLYYERYKSAKAAFEKLVNADPNNADAAYWLGQTLVAPEEGKDVAGAKALYQKALAANSTSPLLLAGMGHIELLEGKTQDARNRFETAISLSQGKSAAVLNAIGLANVMAKDGDVNYAIDKLKLATAIKKMNDPDVFINLGDAYKKITEGGPAQTAYEGALTLSPNYARAPYRIGKIYQTQGGSQKEIYMRYFNDAIAKDPAYGPVYQNLYELLYTTDVAQSAAYLDKYLANTDDDPKNCYYRASMKYAQGLFAEAISKADECLAAPGGYLKSYGIKAYAYNKLGDSVNAKAAFETYFSKADPSIIGAGDLSTYASVLLKFPGSDSVAGTYTDKAVALDTLEANKVLYIKSMAGFYDGQKKYKESADWYSKLVAIKKVTSKTDLYNAGYNYFRSGYYDKAIAQFDIYSAKFPEDAFSYYMKGKSNWAIDSTLELALANASFEKTIEVGIKDSVKYKNQLIGSYKYFIVYYASSAKKDKALALGYCDKVLSIDPNDTETIGNKAAIAAMNFNAPAPKQPKPAPAGTKPAKTVEKTNGVKKK
jgi:tetratricopeptide (TPR) repeat protein